MKKLLIEQYKKSEVISSENMNLQKSSEGGSSNGDRNLNRNGQMPSSFHSFNMDNILRQSNSNRSHTVTSGVLKLQNEHNAQKENIPESSEETKPLDFSVSKKQKKKPKIPEPLRLYEMPQFSDIENIASQHLNSSLTTSQYVQHLNSSLTSSQYAFEDPNALRQSNRQFKIQTSQVSSPRLQPYSYSSATPSPRSRTSSHSDTQEQYQLNHSLNSTLSPRYSTKPSSSLASQFFPSSQVTTAVSSSLTPPITRNSSICTNSTVSPISANGTPPFTGGSNLLYSPQQNRLFTSSQSPTSSSPIPHIDTPHPNAFSPTNRSHFSYDFTLSNLRSSQSSQMLQPRSEPQMLHPRLPHTPFTPGPLSAAASIVQQYGFASMPSTPLLGPSNPLSSFLNNPMGPYPNTPSTTMGPCPSMPSTPLGPYPSMPSTPMPPLPLTPFMNQFSNTSISEGSVFDYPVQDMNIKSKDPRRVMFMMKVRSLKLEKQKDAKNGPLLIVRINRADQYTLWHFLFDQLTDIKKVHNISWTGRKRGQFRMHNPQQVAKDWGNSKHNESMTYEKMSRSIRFYYQSNILRKSKSRRNESFEYQFLLDIKEYTTFTYEDLMEMTGIKPEPSYFEPDDTKPRKSKI